MAGKVSCELDEALPIRDVAGDLMFRQKKESGFDTMLSRRWSLAEE
jgi:hypothetical protein